MYLVTMLLENSEKLFDTIDAISNGKKDGKISLGDLQRFRNSGATWEQRWGVLYPLIEGWDMPEAKKIRDGKYITRESLAKGMGFRSVDFLRDRSRITSQFLPLICP
jgi:hypothetical protein